MSERKSGPAGRTLRTRAITILALAGLAVPALTGLALASNKTLNTTASSSLGEMIAVGSKSRTLYALKGETTKHLLCKSKSCLSVWIPYTVSKRTKLTKASGLKGKLTLLHRNRAYQVVIGGDPLYYYSGDKRKGDINGNGAKSFGGTWHVISGGPIFGHY